MFRKILIANRGEIACRIAKTARRMGIRVVAVYSDADADARHVQIANEAIHIGGSPAAQSYLNIEAIINAAKRTNADAIHPGYGFLSENAEFAESCANADLTFIGPSPDAIRMMASKSVSREIMRNAGVPVLPGYEGTDQSNARFETEAAEIGYPVLVKAVSGGGGKGMRVVYEAAELEEALESARRESASSFGDDRLLLESYLESPRHIEIQIFADNKGNTVHLHDRDCSIQRRYQKIVEEAPAPGLSSEIRETLRKAAIDAARAINYTGAGTVEFLVEADGVYFMEMNTRLQVEHPVTEMVTREDLVEWQIVVAQGQSLPKQQDEIMVVGHAIEARVYAEDPNNDFLPVTGTLNYADFATRELDVRVDTGVRTGDTISIHYDPMIAKIIVWDEDRESALSRIGRALDSTHLTGLTTNLEFLKRVVRHPMFRIGPVTTTFLETNQETLLGRASGAPSEVLAIFVLAELVRRAQDARDLAAPTGDPWSPWALTGNWRLNTHYITRLRFGQPDDMVEINATETARGIVIELPDETVVASQLEIDNQLLSAALDGHRVEATVLHDPIAWTVYYQGEQYRLDNFHDDDDGDGGIAGDIGNLKAPMPGAITAVETTVGAEVAKGDALVVMEAMKMEHTIRAPADGRVTAIHYRVGDTVEDGVQLVDLAVLPRWNRRKALHQKIHKRAHLA